jgi:uncharacterized protein YijF (DUF1287 family)
MRGHLRTALAGCALVLSALACAPARESLDAPRPQTGRTAEKPAAAPLWAPAPAAVPDESKRAAERALGVTDRGVYADLDDKLQLPPPGARAKLSALVDAPRSLLIVYADGWPHKIYPLKGSSRLSIGPVELALRPGDRNELAGRIEPGAVRHLRAGEAAAPGDHDGDGIPDPLDILLGAHKTVLDAASYTDAYFTLGYPNGDPPRDKGACVDVIVRAVRNSGVDLQRAVIEDERAASASYGITRPDPNIDHRRVRNVIVYFRRHWTDKSVSLDDASDPYLPGDVVFLDTFPNRPGPDHVGIVSQERGESGHPLLINLWTFGHKTKAMDLLGSWPVTHRFRFPSKSS